MVTKNLDVVYFVKSLSTRDLVYSIRSVAKNLQYRKLWIIGGKPFGVELDGYIPKLNQNAGNKWDNVQNMYRDVCLNDNITENFILFHDDFFIMKPVDSIGYYYRSELEAHYKDVERVFGPLPNGYTKILRKARRELIRLNKSTLSYELHMPFVFNKHKLLETMGIFPNMNCIRTLYANYWQVGGEKMQDVKIFSNKVDFDWQNSTFLSTDDSLSKEGNRYWEYIKKQFNKPCKYEK